MAKSLSLSLLLACTALGGCQTVGRWANHVGSYMPVVGERCENWQCITSDGQMQSEAIRNQKMEPEQGEEAGEDTEDMPESSVGEPEEFEPIIPPSEESGVPEVEQRGSRKPFPQPF